MWQHDVLRTDGSPYDVTEHAYLRNPINTFLVRNILVTGLLISFLLASIFTSVACFWNRNSLFRAVPEEDEGDLHPKDTRWW